jgi:hypothetical protein
MENKMRIKTRKTRKLTEADISRAIQSVYVHSTGKQWKVKAVAMPTIWRFTTKAAALRKANAIADQHSLRVMVMSAKMKRGNKLA